MPRPASARPDDDGLLTDDDAPRGRPGGEGPRDAGGDGPRDGGPRDDASRDGGAAQGPPRASARRDRRAEDVGASPGERPDGPERRASRVEGGPRGTDEQPAARPGGSGPDRSARSTAPPGTPRARSTAAPRADPAGTSSGGGTPDASVSSDSSDDHEAPDDHRAPEASEAPAAPAASDAATVRARMTAALRGWHAELTAMSGPSALMAPGDAADGLDLSHAHPSGTASFLAGRPTRLSHLFRETSALDHAREQARAIRLTSHALADEHGLRACVLAVGMVSWRGAGGAAVSTPVLLRPIELRPRGAGDYELDLGARAVTNPALVRELARRGVRVDPEELAALAQRQQGFDPTPSLERLRATTRSAVPGMEVRAGLLVTALVDVAPALAADLEHVATELLRAEVPLALSGDEAARERLAQATGRGGEDAAVERLRVLPLDDDQRSVVAAALAGASLRVAAGPGTGATQVAAATVAALVGTGRRVLVVPGQQVEAADVAARLAPAGLAPLVGGGPLTPWPAREDAGPGAARALLEATAALHRARRPWDVGVLDAFAALTRLERRAVAPSTPVVLPPTVLATMTVRERDRAGELLAEAADLGVLSAATGATSWWGADLSDASDAEAALARVVELRSQLLPDLRSQVRVMARATGLREPTSVAQAADLLELVVAVRATLDVFTPHVYERPVTDLVETTAPAAERARTGAPRVGLLARRRAERTAAELLRPGSVPADLHAALAAADASRRAWLSWQLGETTGALPVVPRGLPQTQVLCESVTADLRALAPALATTADGGDLLGARWEALEARLARLEADAAALDSLPRRTTLMVRLRAMGLEPLMDDLRAREVPVGEVAAELQRCWWVSLLEAAAAQDPSLRDLDARRRADLVAAVAGAERSRERTAARTVAEASARAGREGEGAVTVCAPLALPHEVPPDERFDCVVVVGAHRVGLPEAVLAMARAPQVLVVGDPGGLGVAPLDVRAGAEVPERTSVLAACDGALPTVVLGTQHRMPAGLAALAAAAGGVALGAPCLPAAPWASTASLSTVRRGADAATVAARVVDLVAQHARERPQVSLAVVTLDRDEARVVADAVREAYRERPELQEFLGRGAGPREERFVITDAARSGDTVRDAVVVVAGGAGGAGGPGAGDGSGPGARTTGARTGEDAALTVALTRARRFLTLVAVEDATDPPVLAAAVAHLRADAAPRGAAPSDPLLARLVGEVGDVVPVVPGGEVDLLLTGPDRSAGVALLSDLAADPGPVGPQALAALVRREVSLPAELAGAGWRTVQVGAVELFSDPAAVAARVRRALGR